MVPVDTSRVTGDCPSRAHWSDSRSRQLGEYVSYVVAPGDYPIQLGTFAGSGEVILQLTCTPTNDQPTTLRVNNDQCFGTRSVITAPPSTPTPPPTPLPGTRLIVTEGTQYCTVSGNCVTDGAGEHGHNEACTVRVVSAGVRSTDSVSVYISLSDHSFRAVCPWQAHAMVPVPVRCGSGCKPGVSG